MKEKEINRLALAYISHCMLEEMACADMSADSICDHIEDSLQGLSGLQAWLKQGSGLQAWLKQGSGLQAWLKQAPIAEYSLADIVEIEKACHTIMGWADER